MSMRVPRTFLHADSVINSTETQPKEDNSENKYGSNDSVLEQGKATNSCYSCLTACCCCCGSGTRRWTLFTWDHKLRTFCWVTGFLHLFAAIAVLSITVAQDRNSITVPRLKTPITTNIGIWTNANDIANVNTTALIGKIRLDHCPLASAVRAKDSKYVVQQIVLDSKSEVDTRILIIVFHVISFIFQVGSSSSDEYYSELKLGKTNLGHFFEYSISATLMLVAMATQFGITDMYLLLSIGANCAGCMLFGMVAELLFYEDTQFKISIRTTTTKDTSDPPNNTCGISISGHWIAHAAGWFLLMVAIIATCSNLNSIDSCADSSDIKPPTWVLILVSIEVFVFACFGLVQLISFWARDNSTQNSITNQSIAKVTEFAYIFLSASAKMALSIVIIANNYTNK